MSTSKKAKTPKAAKAVKKSSSEPHHPIAKRYIFMALGVVVVISLIFIWYSATQNPSTPDGQDALPSYEELANNDADGDGIEDWRELLLGTSPTAFDTDNDGVGDNVIGNATQNVVDLIQLNRLRNENPDASEEELLILLQEEKNSLNDLNALSTTDRTAQEIYLSTTLLDRINGLTPEIENEIVDGYIEDLIYAYPYPLIAEPDVLRFDNYDPESTETYILQTLALTEVNILDPDPLVFFENYLETRDTELLRKGINESLFKVMSMINQLTATKVPTLFVEDHVILTNSAIRLAIDLSEIQNYEDDALAGYAAFMRYRPNALGYAEAVQSFVEASLAYYGEEL